MIRLSLLLAPVFVFALSAGVEAASSEDMAFFEKEVRPLLISRCYECHSAEKKIKGGLALDTRAAILTGGDSGPGLVAGDLAKSKIIEALRYENHDLQMPPKGRLPEAEVKTLEKWVLIGAPDPRTGVVVAKSGPGKVAEGRKHWAFQPLAQPEPPRSLAPHPVDAFLLQALQAKGLSPAPPVDRRALIRRATFDLIGLPPTPEEVQAFVDDAAPDAFGRVVERLLASPHYGERWARHWLDVARYADSNGMDENIAFGHAWRYRDYVVRAFNNDKPYNDFLIEQIAGDLLPRSEDAVTATGFLSLGARVLAEPDIQKLELDIIDEQIDTLGKAFLGMTLGCVRCHDHKFDPILQDDYYALAAIFRSTKSLSDERMGAIKFWYEHSLATPAQTEAKRKAEEQVKAKRAEVTAFTTKARNEIKAELQSRAADYLAAAATLPMEADYAMVEALAKEHGLRPRYLLTCRQALARQVEHPFFAAWRGAQGNASAVRQHYAPLFAEALISKKGAAYEALTDLAGFLAVPDKDADAFDAATLAKIEGMNQVLKSLEAQAPELPAIMGVAEGTVTRTLPIHIRGSYLTLGKPVERGFPEVMRTSLTKPVLHTKESGRLELARWMASTEHPLTARVAVNRLWRWHFGKGIVSSTDNFGLLGDKPSHPALLDWLARHFMENGWSIKAMHRLLMCSQAYQQDSRVSPSMAGQSDPRLIDPENRLLWRANIQRLEAEQIRDAMLSVSGWLNPQIGGKTIPLLNKQFVFNHTSKDATSYETPRRAVYLPIIRNNLYDMLEQFDYPDPTMPTGSRNSTIVAPQALIMMNAPVAMQSAQKLAARLHDESTDERRVQRLFALLFSRSPTPEEQRRVLALLSDPQAANSPSEAWAQVCQTLLAANEFMYLR